MIVALMFLFLACAYVLLCGFVVFRLKKKGAGKSDFEPSVSVIVAARNEVKHIARCLDSLVALDYPHDKLEIIIVDDNSTDGTGTIVSRYLEGNKANTGGIQIKALFLGEGEKAKPGKAGALMAGITQSSGEIIFVTDADCMVTETWIRSTLSRLDQQVGVSGGPTLILSDNPWAGAQKLELLFLQAVAMVLAEINRPVSWLGNNICFRRSTYDEVGGFENIENTLVEDYAFINAVRRKTNWKVRFGFSSGSAVLTQPLPDLRSLYRQRKRWASDRRNIPVDGLAVMVLNYTVHLLLLLSPFLAPIAMVVPGAVLLLCGNWLVLNAALRRLKMKFSPGDFIRFEAVYILTTCLFPLFFLFDKKVTWKE